MYVQDLTNKFRKKSINEYLPNLRFRSKWYQEKQNIEVIVIDDHQWLSLCMFHFIRQAVYSLF